MSKKAVNSHQLNRIVIRKLVFTYLFLSSVSIGFAQFYNGSQTSFGKNRVQYNKVEWNYYQFTKFDIYYHLGGEELALFTAKRAGKYIDDMQKTFDFNIGNKLQFIVYNNLADFEQSNIGLEGAEQYNIGGVTKVIGSKVLFYFDGNYYNFEKQIKEGIARVIIDQLIYGGDIKDMVKNSTLIHFPDWYIEGLVSYFSEDWNTEKDNLLQDGILSKRFLKFNNLRAKEHVLVGHSLWKYVADKYGKNTLHNILYMSEITRDVDGGFLFVIGKSIKRIRREWFYEKDADYKSNLTDKVIPNDSLKVLESKKQQEITDIQLNKFATKLAYVSNDIGKFKVKIFDFETKTEQTIYKRGFKQNEFKYYENPLIAWNPSGEELIIIDRKKDKIEQYTYNLLTKKISSKTLHKFNQVLSVQFSKNGKDLLLSAVTKEQSDIFILNNQSNKLTQITNDIYSDNYPAFTADNRIIFSSDRIIDSTQNFMNYSPKANFDLYLMDANNSKLTQLTQTPFANETKPQNYFGSIIYLSDSNGTANLFVLKTDTVKTKDTTFVNYGSEAISNNFSSNLTNSTNATTKKYSELIFKNGKYHVFLHDTLATNQVYLANSQYKKWLLQGAVVAKKVDSLLPTSILTDDEIIISIEGILDEVKTERKKSKTLMISDSLNLKALPPERVYNTVFFADYITSQIDNSLINETYQTYNPDFPVFFNPGLNGFLKVGISDLFENKRISGGVKLSSDLSSNEYIATYSSYKNRIDKEFSIHRRSTFQHNNDLFFGNRLHIHNAKAVFKYPFNRISAISIAPNFRFDRKVILPDNNTALAKPITHNTWAGLKLEYVFDNTVNKGLNLFYGTRAKAHFETFVDLKNTKKYSYILGLDVRKYTKLYREVILANRFSAGTSLGSQKVVYYLGGVDGWFAPKFTPTTDIPIDPNQNYIYQTIVTNMRGFAQNIRNGNSYAVLNSEIRIPIVRILSEKPVSSDFFHNLQLIGFYDLGTAWTGLHPFSSENSLNVKTIEKTPVIITIDNNLDPIVQGYGFGVRSRLGGYFIRADWGFGVEEGLGTNNQFYLSLSLDF